MYHASISRAEPIAPEPPAISKGWTSVFKSNPSIVESVSVTPVDRSQDIAYEESKISKDVLSPQTDDVSLELPVLTSHGNVVSNHEWEQASRAGRTASWGAIFYLTATDILGPSSAP